MIIQDERSHSYWCPFTRRAVGDSELGIAACNREANEDASDTSPCIGSLCMAWRWVEIGGPCGETTFSETRGYCGLAGEVRP